MITYLKGLSNIVVNTENWGGNTRYNITDNTILYICMFVFAHLVMTKLLDEDTEQL